MNETQPGEVVDVRVKAARGSCACVAVVDKSVYLLRSGFRLTPAQVSAGFPDLHRGSLAFPPLSLGLVSQ